MTRRRAIVTLYPNSTAIGLNKIAYGLMPTTVAGVSFSLWLRVTSKRRRLTKRRKP